MSLIGEATLGPPPGELIKDGSDAGFVADVVEASKTTPVIVDFWAPWCGPCRQLTPAIEKAVLAAKGAVKLVKIDIDKNPAYAGQLRVQSIPAVFAFVDGRPVDGFMGALPDSQVGEFVQRLARKAAGQGVSPVDDLLAMAAESLGLGDLGGAAQAYAGALQEDPENLKALGGMARLYLQSGDAEKAREVMAMVPPGARDAELDSLRAALTLAETAPSETTGLEAAVAADPADHAARLDLAKALAGQGDFETATDHILLILEADLEWNEGAAKAQLLTVFEAAGLSSDVAKNGRRRLSALLFR